MLYCTVNSFVLSESRKKAASRDQTLQPNNENRENLTEVNPGYASLGSDQSSGPAAYEILASTETSSPSDDRQSDSVYEDINDRDINNSYLELVEYIEPPLPVVNFLNTSDAMPISVL